MDPSLRTAALRDFLLLWQQLFLISHEFFLSLKSTALLFVPSNSQPLTLVTMVSAHLFTQSFSLKMPLQCEIEARKLFSFNSDYG